LTLYRNGAKAGAIPNPSSHTSTKISGLAVDTEYTFHLILRTSAGTYASEKVTVRTHKLTDLSGITVCPGVMPAETREALEAALKRIGAKNLQDTVRIDTTHFVCTEGRGQAWEKAQDLNIPVVRPEWIEACERDGRIVVARNFYLGADLSKIRHNMVQRQAQQSPRLSSTAVSSPLPSELSPTPHPDSGGSDAGSPRQSKAERAVSNSDESPNPSTEKLDRVSTKVSKTKNNSDESKEANGDEKTRSDKQHVDNENKSEEKSVGDENNTDEKNMGKEQNIGGDDKNMGAESFVSVQL
jgi:hypothetical protein